MHRYVSGCLCVDKSELDILVFWVGLISRGARPESDNLGGIIVGFIHSTSYTCTTMTTLSDLFQLRAPTEDDSQPRHRAAFCIGYIRRHGFILSTIRDRFFMPRGFQVQWLQQISYVTTIYECAFSGCRANICVWNFSDDDDFEETKEIRGSRE